MSELQQPGGISMEQSTHSGLEEHDRHWGRRKSAWIPNKNQKREILHEFHTFQYSLCA